MASDIVMENCKTGFPIIQLTRTFNNYQCLMGETKSD